IQGEYEEAKRYYNRALEVWEKALGADHSKVAMILNSLGMVNFEQGEYEEAKGYYKRALGIGKRALGAGHPNLVTSLNNLGMVSFGQGEYEEAEGYYERALEIGEKALGVDHPHVGYPLMGIATVALKMKDPESARVHAERAMSIREVAAVAPELLAEARFVLAQALWSKKHERVRARVLAEQAQDLWLNASRADKETMEYLVEVNAWLATHRVK
ncbi:MAG: tetratricopeptide repeat protein, partial [Myxococcota bacterium]